MFLNSLPAEQALYVVFKLDYYLLLAILKFVLNLTELADKINQISLHCFFIVNIPILMLVFVWRFLIERKRCQ